MISTQQFLDLALDIRTRFPSARVIRSREGDLIITTGHVVHGWLNLETGTLEMFDRDVQVPR